jgi:BON domain
MLTLACSLTLGCATTGSSFRLEDAELSFAVRTALVNDASLGTAPIEVTVATGIVTIAGQVPTAEERLRAVALVRSVPGVRRVDDALTVGRGPTAPLVTREPTRPAALASDVGRSLPHHFAVGGTFTMPVSGSETLHGLRAFGPVFRLGRGAGWHPQVTLARVRADLPATAGTDAFGQLRMLIVGGGLGYGLRSSRWILSVGASAAVSFNNVRLDPGPEVPQNVSLPVAASTSPAILAGSTVWYEANRRMSIGVTTVYLFARPQATWLEGSRFVDRRLNADTVRIGISAAWWVF